MIKLIRTDTTLDLSQKAEKSTKIEVEMIQMYEFPVFFQAKASLFSYLPAFYDYFVHYFANICNF